jgi:hypothetical protein
MCVFFDVLVRCGSESVVAREAGLGWSFDVFSGDASAGRSLSHNCSRLFFVPPAQPLSTSQPDAACNPQKTLRFACQHPHTPALHHPAHVHDPPRQPPTCRHRAAVEEESAVEAREAAATQTRIPAADGDEGERVAHRPAQTARHRRSLLAADHEARTAVLRVEEEELSPLQPPAAAPTHEEAARAAEGTTPMCKPPSSFRPMAEAVVVGSSGTLPGPPPCWTTSSHCNRTPATAAKCAARALY